MLIEKKDYRLKNQDEAQATYAPKLKKNDGLIDWDKPAQDIGNLVRGCLGWPSAFTYYNGKLLKIYKANVSVQAGKRASGSPGEIVEVSQEGITIASGKDNLIIEELQVEGKRRMRVEEFILGHSISIGERLGKK
jgi:methionyl-tRNA formyltransferase